MIMINVWCKECFSSRKYLQWSMHKNSEQYHNTIKVQKYIKSHITSRQIDLRLRSSRDVEFNMSVIFRIFFFFFFFFLNIKLTVIPLNRKPETLNHEFSSFFLSYFISPLSRGYFPQKLLNPHIKSQCSWYISRYSAIDTYRTLSIYTRYK